MLQPPQAWDSDYGLSHFTDEESEVQRSNLKLKPPRWGGEEAIARVLELGRGRTGMQTH